MAQAPDDIAYCCLCTTTTINTPSIKKLAVDTIRFPHVGCVQTHIIKSHVPMKREKKIVHKTQIACVRGACRAQS